MTNWHMFPLCDPCAWYGCDKWFLPRLGLGCFQLISRRSLILIDLHPIFVTRTTLFEMEECSISMISMLIHQSSSMYFSMSFPSALWCDQSPKYSTMVGSICLMIHVIITCKISKILVQVYCHKACYLSFLLSFLILPSCQPIWMLWSLILAALGWRSLMTGLF